MVVGILLGLLLQLSWTWLSERSSPLQSITAPKGASAPLAQPYPSDPTKTVRANIRKLQTEQLALEENLDRLRGKARRIELALGGVDIVPFDGMQWVRIYAVRTNGIPFSNNTITGTWGALLQKPKNREE
jgi:hypothetical protein